MTRLNLLLLFVLIACALGVVTSQHKARRAYIELQKAQAEARRLDVEWGQLQLEQSTWAMHSRIEREASTRLNMRVPDGAHTQLAPVAGGAQ
ncbi:cell division protein FtsL [Chitinimonas viridis]|uniref:Cell division protein FtsL n=2 Tax=Chitinimonas TaxID=240411 RepID=A0ABT8B9C4_9NEIS|nr:MULTISPECIES: cell division protein FtsL [Chitinimonas]MBL8509223.1 cell division protein FtsL [Chitinimonas sp.]MDN3578748.1 cell division protein FtsL [Chitinimonas viridis]GLR12595.1 cell division protein FtsL [Chitinimonas prasina]